MHTSHYNTVAAPRIRPLAFGDPPRGYGDQIILILRRKR